MKLCSKCNKIMGGSSSTSKNKPTQIYYKCNCCNTRINEKKIENAKAEAEVMRQQNQQITEETLKLKELEIKQKLIEKWNGQYPTTMLNDNMTALFDIE